MNGTLTLYSYWRSSAAYRVRIALQLKQLAHDILPVHLVRDGGEQHTREFHALNPQEQVPVLMHGQRVLRQSLAIMEYLEETFPDHPLMPATARDRARVRGIAQLLACDVHPLNNLRILQFFDYEWHVPQPERDAWVRHWIGAGFAALEDLLNDNPSTGDYCEGDVPSMADCCLIPQVYNARRFGLDLAAYPNIARINDACLALPEFDLARPENQPDAPSSD